MPSCVMFSSTERRLCVCFFPPRGVLTADEFPDRGELSPDLVPDLDELGRDLAESPWLDSDDFRRSVCGGTTSGAGAGGGGKLRGVDPTERGVVPFTFEDDIF